MQASESQIVAIGEALKAWLADVEQQTEWGVTFTPRRVYSVRKPLEDLTAASGISCYVTWAGYDPEESRREINHLADYAITLARNTSRDTAQDDEIVGLAEAMAQALRPPGLTFANATVDNVTIPAPFDEELHHVRGVMAVYLVVSTKWSYANE